MILRTSACERSGYLPTLARVMPFGVFIALMAIEPWMAGNLANQIDARWFYGLRSAVTASLILYFWRQYEELNQAAWPRPSDVALAVFVGIGVLVLWLLLDDGIFLLGEQTPGFDPRNGDGQIDWGLALTRLAGAALVVPVMEELFWRAWLMRYLQDRFWETVTPSQVTRGAILLSSVVFGLEHQQWAAGILAGLAYAWLYWRSNNLWLAVISHAVTNFLLGCFVLARGAWYFW